MSKLLVFTRAFPIDGQIVSVEVPGTLSTGTHRTSQTSVLGGVGTYPVPSTYLNLRVAPQPLYFGTRFEYRVPTVQDLGPGHTGYYSSVHKSDTAGAPR